MKILGIDTATDICGIALTENERLITEIRSNFKRAHAEKLIDSIDRVLQDGGISLNDLDVIAVSIGPGSFTGLRIGLATVKGLAFTNQIPVVAVNTLDALAHQAIFWSEQVCPLLHAQADEAYTALYEVRDFDVKQVTDYQLLLLENLHEFITRKTLIINAGMKHLDEFITSNEKKLIHIAPDGTCFLNGFTIARLGFKKFQAGEIEDIETLEPYYLKEFKVKQKSGFRHG